MTKSTHKLQALRMFNPETDKPALLAYCKQAMLDWNWNTPMYWYELAIADHAKNIPVVFDGERFYRIFAAVEHGRPGLHLWEVAAGLKKMQCWHPRRPRFLSESEQVTIFTGHQDKLTALAEVHAETARQTRQEIAEAKNKITESKKAIRWAKHDLAYTVALQNVWQSLAQSAALA